MEAKLARGAQPVALLEGLDWPSLAPARIIEPTPSRYKAKLPTPLPPGRSAWTEEEIVDQSGELVHRQYRVVGSSYVANESAGTVPARKNLHMPS